MKLVIVESPTKAKTIKRFLPSDYVVESSLGHIRDLPKAAEEIPAKYKKEKWARLGINIEQDFAPLYIIPKDKQKHIAKLKKLIAEADELFLATDEDREGEAISWHLLQVLAPDMPVKRMVFHEITKEAIQHALATPREIDMHLVEAQETRRLLDRLYGYEVSPILWRKVAPKLSAGRVQSAALQFIVERERERMRFISGAYWDVLGQFTTSAQANFEAKLVSVDQRKFATGADFGPDGNLTAEATKRSVVVLSEAEANQLATEQVPGQWQVTDLQRKPVTTSPRPPFTTSTIQQEAGRKLGWAASRTMRTAQRLYEQGFITYMRTDSVVLSQEAIAAAREKITKLYGADYVPAEPRIYKTKSKSAQEAHEAIRPAGTAMRTVEEVSAEVSGDELKLYEFIWQRTVASQMADAKMQQTSIQLTSGKVVAHASGRTIEFPGYLRAYVEGADDPDADLSDREKILPSVAVGETVTATSLTPQVHATKPPARYTEASLVKELEAQGIGRPSTYATIIETIQRRGYVFKAATALVPRFVAFAVVDLLHHNFPNLVDTSYTASMEEDLDTIAAGEKESLPYLKQFYFGNDQHAGLASLLKAEIDARKTCTIPIGQTPAGETVNVRVGRYGPFVEILKNATDDKGITASIPDDLPPDELTVERAVELAEKKAQGPMQLGTDPVTNDIIYLIEGRFGPYVQRGEKKIITEGAGITEDTEKASENTETENAEKNTGEKEGDTGKKKKKKVKRVKKPKIIKPKIKGLAKGMTVDQVTLDIALQLLQLPKTVGVFPDNNEPIVADIGRFGSYIKAGVETRSLKADDNILTLTLERSIELLRTPKSNRGRRGASPAKLLGDHPELKKPIELRNGKFGPYVKCGKVSASLPNVTELETVTLEQAIEAINNKVNA